jgi:ribose-phosphate pyrophosphokinase
VAKLVHGRVDGIYGEQKMKNDLKVFAGNSNPGLAAEICEQLKIEPGKIKIRKFSNGRM